MKMTEENWGRLAITIFFVVAAVATRTGYPFPTCIVFSVCAMLLAARGLYSYMKGR